MKDKPSPKIISEALMKFIDSSKDTCITIDKINQLRKDVNTTYKNCLYLQKDIFVTYQLAYKNIYLIVELGKTAYILKFANAFTFKFFTDGFEPKTAYADYLFNNCSTIFNYDELEVEQDGYDYNIIIGNGLTTDSAHITVIDKKLRKSMCCASIDELQHNTWITEFGAQRFDMNKGNIGIDKLPENIKTGIMSCATLATLGDK